MPLILPNQDPKASSSGSGDVSDWQNKLLGKTLADSHSETAFAKKDLPEKHRVMEEGAMSTMDHDENRLNIVVSNDGIVKKVTKG